MFMVDYRYFIMYEHTWSERAPASIVHEGVF